MYKNLIPSKTPSNIIDMTVYKHEVHPGQNFSDFIFAHDRYLNQIFLSLEWHIVI